ncbi:hypothetical protein B0T17DRAFT_586568 [Bombardia bombarda]|uniref:Methyltransferase type 11 domain-containing protein n=1 Tax=Bombardia bombarda TaxID=252184 RepID=A0AA39XIZ9_9PEZI|nr:hypothetical protein B0T17DRAFT_586568 [Bombardia bombarda]
MRLNFPRACRPQQWRPIIARRTYAFQAPSGPIFDVFNRNTKWLQKERAAANVEHSRQADYLKDEVAARVCDRLQDIKRHFPRALDLGANSCNIARALSRPTPNHDNPDGPPPRPPQPSFDLVLSNLSMHWINNLPGVLAQINSILKPDCPFIGAMLGGDTLFELRTSLQLAEQERRGGISPHVSPLADVRDVGGLLQRAGFKMLTVDVEDIVVDFPDTFALMQDLQAMGESSAILGREMGAIGRDVLLANDAIYRELHGNEDGTIPATFRVIHMIGWRESDDQVKPLARGSGQVNLKDILEGGK